MLTIATGAIAGLFHVLTGPDHLTAVAPLAVTDGRRGWLAGWTWGIGHACGVAVVAVLAVLFRDLLPSVDAISMWSERLVGAVLIGVGVWALRRSLRIDSAPHTHGPTQHHHLHVAGGPAWLRHLGHAHASFYLGILHGLAGSSHFLGVLPALALPSREAALAYVAAFGIGSVAAMTAFAAGIGVIGDRVPAPAAHRLMMRTAAVLAFGVGAFWLIA